MVRVPVKPEILEWACERSDYTVDSFVEKYPKVKLREWIEGKVQPTLKQLESFARATRTPIGYFFLPEPPRETIPISDFRTVKDRIITRPSPDLLDTIYICQQRQEWYRDYARMIHEPPVELIGSVNRTQKPEAVAEKMRSTLRFSIDERKQMSAWSDALRRFIEQSEEIGILVMVNGVVGSNNNRKLDPSEFRGFALCDPLAPLVFINGSDSKSAQMFTLAHELAHLWLGETALSDAGMRMTPSHDVEKWCNAVAAELLVPMDAIKEYYRDADDLTGELNRLAGIFKVSTLVILRRIYDAGKITRKRFWAAYDEELKRLQSLTSTSSGGNFYYTTASRVSRRFARAIIGSAFEGHASFTETLRLLGFKQLKTLHVLGSIVGVEV